MEQYNSYYVLLDDVLADDFLNIKDKLKDKIKEKVFSEDGKIQTLLKNKMLFGENTIPMHKNLEHYLTIDMIDVGFRIEELYLDHDRIYGKITPVGRYADIVKENLDNGFAMFRMRIIYNNSYNQVNVITFDMV